MERPIRAERREIMVQSRSRSLVAALLAFAALRPDAASLASVRNPSWHRAAPAPSPAKPATSVPVAVAAGTAVANGVTRLTVDLSAAVPVETALAEGPDRLVIDLPEVNFQVDPAVGRGGATGAIKGFRFGLVAPGRSRIVVDLGGPVALRRAEVASIAGGAASRLVVEVAPTDRASFHAVARRPRPDSPPPPSAPPAAGDPRPVVVIDPGHGGVDPGAIGLFGGVEKDVALQFAAALAAKLSAGDRYRVVMTRRDDSFVSLGDRVRIARDAEAALFISVHADSLAAASVAGATVYTASDRASDAEAERVAATENQADAAAGLDEVPRSADVSDILFDLARRETRTYAHQFQRTLLGYWAKTARLNRNPERSAGFKVLQAPDVPSVLLELGYLSSGQDARTLASPDWRARTADGVAAAVDAFFAGRAASPAPAGASGPGPAVMR